MVENQETTALIVVFGQRVLRLTSDKLNIHVRRIARRKKQLYT